MRILPLKALFVNVCGLFIIVCKIWQYISQIE